MKNSVGRMSVLVSVLVVLLFTPMRTASAVANLGISPAYPVEGNLRSQNIFLRTIKPGETVKDGVKITNESAKPYKVQIRAVDTVSSVSGSFSCRQDSEPRTDVGKWIVLNEDEIEIQPNETKVVDFTISVPLQSSPGEHGGCITVQADDDFAKSKGSGIQLGFRSAVRVAITVPGKIIKNLSITRIEITPTDGDFYQVAPFFKNSGNVSLDVRAHAQLESVFGQKTKALDSGSFPVMRDTTTSWPFKFERPFWGGFYKARTSVTYNYDPNDGIGENTSKHKKVSKESGYVLLIPAPQAIAIEAFVVLAPIVLLTLIIRSRRHKRQVMKKWHSYTVKEGDTIVSLATERKAKWKRIAKMNKLKAPYSIHPGDRLVVPNVPLQALPAKKIQPVPLHVEMAQTAGPEPVAPAAPQPVDQPIPAFVSPRSPGETLTPGATTMAPTPANTSPTDTGPKYVPLIPAQPTSPVANSAYPYEDEVDDEPMLDWREGANKDELRALGVIEDAGAVPKLFGDWNRSEEVEIKPTAKKVVNKSTSKKPKKPTKKKAS